MTSPPASRSLMRKVLLLALLGFAALVLAGPILVLLGFALLGLLVYSVVRLIYRGRGPALRTLGDVLRNSRRFLYYLVCRALAVVGWAGREGSRTLGVAGKAAWGKVKAEAPQVGEAVASGVNRGINWAANEGAQKLQMTTTAVASQVGGKARYVGGIILEMLCGAAVGALFTFVGWTRGEFDVALLIGAAGGALLGFLIGAARKRRSSESY